MSRRDRVREFSFARAIHAKRYERRGFVSPILRKIREAVRPLSRRPVRVREHEIGRKGAKNEGSALRSQQGTANTAE